MRKIAKTAAVSAAAIAVALGTAVTPVAAETAESSIALAGPITAGKGAATVPVVYTCHGGAHVWAALKQGEGVQENPSTGSNPGITSFYDTNWKVDAGPNALRCDGRERRQTLVLKTHVSPWYPGGAPLTGNTALLQLCLYDAVAPDGVTNEVDGTYPMVALVGGR